MDKKGTFTIDLSEKAFEPNVLLKVADEKVLKILTKPKLINGKWYHKILRFLTFGYFFIPIYRYDAKQVNITNNE